MSTIQRVAQIFGWVFVAVAILGFFVSRGSMEADPAMAPKVLGLFPVNLLHNLVHLAFGVWGIMAARSISAAKSYALGAGVIYLVLTVLGFIIPTTFGLIPIGGNDIWLHALIAVVLLGAWASARSATATPATAGPTPTTTSPPPPPPEPRTSTPPATGGPTGGTTGGRSGGPAGGSTPGGTSGGAGGSGGAPGGAGGSSPGSSGGPGAGPAGDRPSSPPPPPASGGEGDRRP